MSDDELLGGLLTLVDRSRRVESELVAHVGEVDLRRLYLREAAPSMFAYCTEVLHLSEHEAYLRITVSRAARKYPELSTMLGDGRLTLSAIARLAPHIDRLGADDRRQLLDRATHRSRRQVEELVAALAPRPDVPAKIRKIPRRPPGSRHPGSTQLGPDRVDASAGAAPAATEPAVVQPAAVLAATAQPATGQPVAGPPVAGPPTAGPPTAGPPTAGPPTAGQPTAGQPVKGQSAAGERAFAAVEPLAPERYKVTFTASSELREKLERLQSLLPGCDLAEVIEQAVGEKLERIEARRFGKTPAPRAILETSDLSAGKRAIPAAVRRLVFERDGGRCTFVNDAGRCCGSRWNLEFHHDRPFALGGGCGPDNIRLLCRAHNDYLAQQTYGPTASGAGLAGEVTPPGC